MILIFGQAIFAFISIGLVLLQEPADDRVNYASFFSPQPVKRGWEKIVFVFTIFNLVLFVLISFLRLVTGK